MPALAVTRPVSCHRNLRSSLSPARVASIAAHTALPIAPQFWTYAFTDFIYWVLPAEVCDHVAHLRRGRSRLRRLILVAARQAVSAHGKLPGTLSGQPLVLIFRKRSTVALFGLFVARRLFHNGQSR